ncbi:MerR family transcriptional regulator [Pseudonocardia acaciae]|uniref:MerR family transcriptional regulator n=1 Tax=Pseudonocardia acaciae TaxID=551276 RepID=UPI000566230E|nr:MerR family transcriptional regulator [Pseudonocardia acaciae]
MTKLIPIADVAAHFALPVSTLRFWERRGLLTSHRQGSRRCYDREQLYRIASIKRSREVTLLGIEQIRELIATRPATAAWRHAIDRIIDAISRRISQLEDARDYLHHLRDCPHQGRADTCPGFRATVTLPRAARTARHTA